MFHEGVTCSDCHEPHSLKLRFEKNGVCLQCHEAAKFDTPDHHQHAMNTEGAECASCHMPERTPWSTRAWPQLPHPQPVASAAVGAPNACNACHADETPEWAAGKIAAWHPDPHTPFQQFGRTLDDGARGAPGARERLIALAADGGQPGIARASAIDRLDRVTSRAAYDLLVGLLDDPDTLVLRSAAAAFATIRARAPLPLRPRRGTRARRPHEPGGSSPRCPTRRSRPRRWCRASSSSPATAPPEANPTAPRSHHNLGLVEMALVHRRQSATSGTRLPSTRCSPRRRQPRRPDAGRRPRAEGGPILRAIVEKMPDEAMPGWRSALAGAERQAGRSPRGTRRAFEAGRRSRPLRLSLAVSLADAGSRAEAMRVLPALEPFPMTATL
jgi:hypothetical protein